MNCFEWQSLSSDYLDGTLELSTKQQADQHVGSCKDCNERHRRFRLILSSLASQPRSALPIPIRKSPLVSPIEKSGMRKLSKSKWQDIPWYFRTAIEGGLVALFILLGISAGPRIRSLYERSVERKVDDFSDSLAPEEPENAAARSNQISSAPALPALGGKPTTTDTSGNDGGEDFASSDDEDADGEEVAVDQDENLHVGKSEVWRFNLKSDSPGEMRPQIIKTLSELGVPATLAGLNGIEAPGGIQFDLVLAQSVVTNLKHHLQKMAPLTPNATQASSKEPFTWYKKKSRTPIPEGKARVVIWISQI